MKLSYAIFFLVILTLQACDRVDYKSTTDNIAENNITEEYGLDSIQSSNRKMVRTANLKASVHNALDVTSSIERKVKLLNGIVEESHFSDSPISQEDLPYSNDSLLSIKTFEPVATLKIRIPIDDFDSFMHEFPSLTKHIEQRTINQKDASFEHLGNYLKKQSSEDLQAIARQKIKTTDDAIDAEANAHNTIQNKINNYVIDDQVAFSTIVIDLSEQVRIEKEFIPNISAVKKLPFWIEVKMAVATGLDILKSILLLLLKGWFLWLFVLLIWVYKGKFAKWIKYSSNIENA